MRDPFPLAEIPLAAADESNERESPGAAGDLSMRALVPHGSAMATGGAESGEPLRSEDDTALMRSLISLMPHERADSQVRDTKPPSYSTYVLCLTRLNAAAVARWWTSMLLLMWREAPT